MREGIGAKKVLVRTFDGGKKYLKDIGIKAG